MSGSSAVQSTIRRSIRARSSNGRSNSMRPDRNAVSGPSRDATDVEVAAIKVPVISCKTAFSCLDRVCAIDGKRMKTALRWVEDIDERVLPLDRLMAIAENSGLHLRR